MKTTVRTVPVNGIELQIIEAGPPSGPLVLLLHGFPDFWWGWRYQIEPLAEQGFHVVVPDQRGYNLSSKPSGVASYDLDVLAADVIGLADALGASKVHLVGHDWGGLVAWWAAAHYPQRVERLAILNAPHPDVFPRYLRRHPKQMLKSSYVAFFQLPVLPEALMKARRFAFLRDALTGSSHPGTFTDEDLERYTDAWAQPGALTAMVNYYRALARRPWGRFSRVQSPTLLIWGTQDQFLETGVGRASLKLCDEGQSLFIESAGHWVQLEEAERVNAALLKFFQAD
jgi:pimeloyl-ACP methyl ester carboxylesterase